MKNSRRSSPSSSHARLLALLNTEFQSAADQARELFREFLPLGKFNAGFCSKLLSFARQPEVAWEIRRLAVLMIENQTLKLPSDSFDQFDWLFTQLDLKRPGRDEAIVDSVLHEGYSTNDFYDFIPEFLRKLKRLDRVHRKIRGARTSLGALREFIELSRRDCKLSLARYLFSPDEIVAQILSRLQTTDGVIDVDSSEPAYMEQETSRAIERLPDYEAQILNGLRHASKTYWVAESTSSEINSLVEYPLTTVVLVIKPPGSDVEFEIKRAGRKSNTPLNVVYARNGYTVPPSHRLDGGSMQWLLRFEANSASRLALIYRLVHQTEAPLASYVSRSTIYSVPTSEDEVQTLPYFTDADSFGHGFREMRVAMAESVAAFKAEGYGELPVFPGDLGLTAQFINHVNPAQAILCGTSSFRLDKLARYLSSEGAKQYFIDDSPSTWQAQRFADEILEEVLGVYEPPRARYRTHDQYVAAAFSVAGNRVRADAIYLSLVEQIARLWGTLLAVRGHSRGESFVGRNVGLKSFWHNGEWQVTIIFMDHDALEIPGPENKFFYAHGTMPNTFLDERHIWSRLRPEMFATSAVGYLNKIYRAGDDLDAQGQQLARVTLKDAYRKTLREMTVNAQLRALFNQEFIERLCDWDELVHGRLQLNGDKSVNAKWKRKMKRMLSAKRYRREAFDSYVEIIDKYREFLLRNWQLFDIERDPSQMNRQ